MADAPAPIPIKTPLPEVLRRLGLDAGPSLFEALQGQPEVEGPLFTTSAAEIVSTAPPVISGAHALLRGDQWSPVAIGKGSTPEYRYQFKRGLVTHNIAADNPETQRLDYVVGDAAWGLVNAFDTPTAFLHLLFAAHAAQQEKPWEGLMALRGTDLINALGLGRRKDLTKAEKLDRLTQQALLLGTLGVRLNWTFPNSQKVMDNFSRMWEVSVTRIGQKHLPGGEAAEDGQDLIPDEVIISVRPGQWSRYFLNREGLKDGSSLFWTGYMAASTLQFDPYQEPVASKLAIHFTLTMAPGQPRRNVRPLVEFAFSAEEREAAHADRRRRHDLKQQFDNALYALSRAGWRISFPEATYPAYLVPDWARPDGSGPRPQLPHGYFEAFLRAAFEVRPPVDLPQRLALAPPQVPAEGEPAKQPSAKRSRMTGEEIRKARKAAGMSQQQLGDLLQKSRAWVAHVERGTRTPSPGDQTQLRRIFAQTGGDQA